MPSAYAGLLALTMSPTLLGMYRVCRRLVLYTIGIVTCILLIRFAFVSISVGGYTNKPEEQLPASCEKIEIHPGTEDIEALFNGQRIFISAADRRRPVDKNNHVNGGIFTMEVGAPDTVKRANTASPKSYRPHGIDIYEDNTGLKRLFAVVHDVSGQEYVVIYDILPSGLLEEIEAIEFDDMWQPNSVVAVGPRQFYVTNGVRFGDGLFSLLERFLALPLTSVAFYDGASGRTVAEGLAYANGITASADMTSIFVATFLTKQIVQYRRDVTTGALRELTKIDVPTGPDNLRTDAAGHIWIGGHQNGYAVLAHAKDPKKIAPAHAVKINPDTGSSQTVVFAQNGELSASSVALPVGDKLYLGSIFQSHILSCDFP